MKSYFGIDKRASSALIFTAFTLFTGTLQPAKAAPEATTETTKTVASSTQTVLASTDLAKPANAPEAMPGLSWSKEVALAANPEATETNVNQLTSAIALTPETTFETDAATQPEPDSSALEVPVESLDSEQAADPMDQVTNISQLSDVRPGDWAYESLRQLVERYGCIAGYPDGTFRGNRALTRYEFAAGVNACLQQVEKLIAASTTDVATKEDLDALRRLVDEFQAEIATLGARVDKLEGRVAFLENHQFSTTTKLFGQAIVGLQGRDAGDINLAGFRFRDENTNINVISNVQLSLLTQFSPRSVLLTGLQAGAGNTGRPVLTNDVLLGYEGDTNNSVILSDLTYRHLITNNFAVVVGPEGVNPVNVFRGANRVESAGFGPLSRFAQRNPIINIGSGRGGVGFDWQIIPKISLQGVYSSSSPENTNNGIFGGDYGRTTTGVQLNFAPTSNVDIAFDYINSYSHDGFLGMGVGDDQLALPTPAKIPFPSVPLRTNAFGLTGEWRVTPGFTIGGWGGYTTSEIPGESGNVETINWMGFLNFPDLFRQGNLAGIYVGQPPKITSSTLNVGRNVPGFFTNGDFVGNQGGQPDSTLHVEAFYRFRVSDNISLTPGVIVIFNPRHNENNDTITIGSLRTTFTF